MRLIVKDGDVGYIRSAVEAEECAAATMRRWGFVDARITGKGADSGLDVIASTAVAQVKWKTAQVGRPELQALYGARARHHHRRMLFFAASGYSAPAIQYADENDMLLFVYDPLGTITPANAVGRRFLADQRGKPATDRRKSNVQTSPRPASVTRPSPAQSQTVDPPTRAVTDIKRKSVGRTLPPPLKREDVVREHAMGSSESSIRPAVGREEALQAIRDLRAVSESRGRKWWERWRR